MALFSHAPKEHPRPYQIEGARFLAARRARMLLDAMRVGKTPTAIHACDLVRAERIVWVTKGRARWKHAEDWAAFQTLGRAVKVLSSGKDVPLSTGVNIVSYELMAGPLLDALIGTGPQVVVFDEFHQLGNRKTKRTQAAYGKHCDGAGSLISTASFVWLLSGTPIPRDPSQIYATLKALFPQAIAVSGSDTCAHTARPMDYWSFVGRYCAVQQTPFGRKITGAKNMPALREKVQPYFLRRTFAEVQDQVPPLRFEEMPLDTKEYLAALRKREMDAVLEELGITDESSDKEVDAALRGAHEATQRRLAKLTGLAKIRPLAAAIAEELDEGLEKIVVFAWHREVIEQLAEALKLFGAVTMYGGSAGQPDRVFAADPNARVFIGQIEAAGEAIDLSVADEIVFAEPYWTDGKMQQAYYRCSNPMKRRPVRVRFARASDGIDAKIMRVLKERAQTAKELFE